MTSVGGGDGKRLLCDRKSELVHRTEERGGGIERNLVELLETPFEEGRQHACT